LQSYSGSINSGRATPFPLLSSRSVTPDDPYRSHEWLTWPENVLLAGTLEDGIATLPVPTTLWSYATLINLSYAENAVQAVAETVDHDVVGTVSPKHWHQWRVEAVSKTSTGLLEFIHEIEASVGHPISLNSYYKGFLNICSDLNPKSTHEDMLKFCLIPLLAANGTFKTIEKIGTKYKCDLKALQAQVEFAAGISKWA